MSEAEAGLVVVDKPGGITSHGVVARVRRMAGTRKVGHAGTLDPMATGVLVLGVGRATRLLGHLMLTRKAYEATIRLGATTTTDDAEGDLVAAADPAVLATISEEAVREGLARFVGEIEQVPSAVSAIKVDGRRAYQRVRDGEQIELASRRVTIDELGVGEIRPMGEGAGNALDVTIALRCSSGTYVRAIARDLGELLGVGGHLTRLRRTAVGPYDLGLARTLEDLDADYAPLPLAAAARAAFVSVDLSEEHAADVRVGRALDLPVAGITALFDPTGAFLALYEPRDGRARAVAVFQ